jgi:hypothetical protein
VRAALVEYGAFALVDVPGLSEATADALGALPACTRSDGHAAGAKVATGQPFRTTVAARSTAGVAGANDLGACAPSLRSLRALVGASTRAVAGAIDAGFPETMGREGGGRYSFAQLASEGEQLEHFHLYPVAEAADARAAAVAAAAAAAARGAPWTLPVHTDAGLLAVMTAGFYMAADPLAPAAYAPPPADGGLFLKLRSGELVRVAQAAADAPRPSLLVFAGEGAASWLRAANGSASAIRAAPHALRVGTGPAGAASGPLVRGWHGRMLLPPADALLPAAPPAGLTTGLAAGLAAGRASGLSFGKHWLAEAERTSKRAAPTQPSTCGAHAALPSGTAGAASAVEAATAARRRLHEGEDHSADGQCTTANGKAGIKCWMTCMDITDLGCPAARARCYDSATALTNAGVTHCAKTCAPACDAVDRDQMVGLVVGLVGGCALLVVVALCLLRRRAARSAADAGAKAAAPPTATRA